MHVFTKRSSLVAAAIALVATGLVLGPVARAQSKSATQSVDSLNKVLTEATKVRKQVQAALDSLLALSSGGTSDLTKDYKTFSKNVAGMTQTAEKVKARVEDMQQRREAYLDEWQKKMKSVSSPDIQAHMTERAKEVKRILESSQPEREAARDAFRPFMTNLQDIDKLLSVDLSAAGVTAAAPIAEDALANGNIVLQRLDAFIGSLTRVRDQISPKKK